MSIQRAEQLKRDLTDKSVMVTDNVAELRRFAGLVGRVITVNMNGRALVQFNGPADVGWYDIDPSYLQIVSAPVRKMPDSEANDAPVRPASKTTASATKSAVADKPAAPAAAEGGKKLSPLELARQQGAAKAAGAEAPAAPKPAAAAPADGKKLSPLELARQQGAAKSGGAAAAAPAPAPPAPAPKPAPAPAPKPAPAPAPKPSSPPSGAKLSTAEILALARKQDSKG